MSHGTQPPGWYPAEGDPAGTVRWWDGNSWVGGPQQQGAQQQAGYVAPNNNQLANGREIADPWLRIAASIIDAIIVTIITVTIAAYDSLYFVTRATLRDVTQDSFGSSFARNI